MSNGSRTWLYNFSFSATCGPLSWIIPAEIFDARTRSKGVSIATMTSFAFNTLIGQITGESPSAASFIPREESPGRQMTNILTDTAMTNIGYKYYYLFIICNLTNAITFYLFLPETARLPLEEMNYLFAVPRRGPRQEVVPGELCCRSGEESPQDSGEGKYG